MVPIRTVIGLYYHRHLSDSRNPKRGGFEVKIPSVFHRQIVREQNIK